MYFYSDDKHSYLSPLKQPVSLLEHTDKRSLLENKLSVQIRHI